MYGTYLIELKISHNSITRYIEHHTLYSTDY